MDVPPPILEAVAALRRELGDELHSCCLYGSAVREDGIPPTDFNLLIVLRTSTAAGHGAVARAIGANRRIEPFVLGLAGFERSVRAFAAKFASIKRHYRVVHGADPLAAVEIAPELERFLCEQALRNLRLRLVHSFVTREQHGRYAGFLAQSVTPLFLRLSEILRLSGGTHANAMPERIPTLAAFFHVEAKTLDDLLDFKTEPRRLSDEECVAWHERTFAVVNAAAAWIEANWPAARSVE